jgi:hypothetical protein
LAERVAKGGLPVLASQIKQAIVIGMALKTVSGRDLMRREGSRLG